MDAQLSPAAGGSPSSPSRGALPAQVRLAELVAAARRTASSLQAELSSVLEENARLGDELAAAQAANLDLQTEVNKAAGERREAEEHLASVQADAARVKAEADALEVVRACGGGCCRVSRCALY